MCEIGSRGFCGIDPIVGVPDTDRQIDRQDKYAACGGVNLQCDNPGELSGGGYTTPYVGSQSNCLLGI